MSPSIDDGILQQDLDSIYQLIFDYNVESMANYDTQDEGQSDFKGSLIFI